MTNILFYVLMIFIFYLTGGTVHMVCRNKERGEEAQKDIKEKSGNQVC